MYEMNINCKKQRKVLIIAYYFPPALTGGVFRPLKFVKYLNKFAWQPVVLTAKKIPFVDYDFELLNELPSAVHVYRAPFLSPTTCARNLKNAYRSISTFSLLKLHSKYKINDDDKASHSRPCLENTSTFAKLLNTMLIPDAQLLWLPIAFLKAFYLIKRHSISMIMTTSPPNSSHVLGFILKKITRVKWIADFRDPWFSNLSGKSRSMFLAKQRLKVEKSLLKKILLLADSIINIGFGESNELKKSFPEISETKYFVITNGYDTDDFRDTFSKELSKDSFRLCHLGYLYQDSAEDFFPAINDILTEDQTIKDNLEIRFVGRIDPKYKNLIEKSDFTTTYRLYGQLPHHEALKIVLESDVLLVFLGGTLFNESEIPGKLFEYIATKKPIIAIAPKKGDTAQILKKCGLGIIIEPGQTDDYKHAIKDLYDKKMNNEIKTHVNEDFLLKFDRKQLTKRLADIMTEVIKIK
jgi:glycosyltransferase involved in cell wall biosynthesis